MLLGAGLTLAGSFGLGSALTRKMDALWPVRLCTGAGVLSLIVFVLMTLGVADRPVLAGISVAGALLGLRRPRFIKPRVPVWAAVLLGVYSLLYLAHASGPEVQADPNIYHLTPAREALKHGGFGSEVTFYDRLPHALELLFVIAYAFGEAPAAKLVHLGFLFATVPLIVGIGRRLGLPDAAAYGAALLYFMSPVVGVTGTAAFNDAALVCATLAMILVLLEDGPAWLAGLLAGFCYAIKLTGGLAIPVGLLMLAARKRWRDAVIFGAAASILVLPWTVRNAVQTGNPVAPFFNRWFPNPYFHIVTEKQLSTQLRTYGVPMPERLGEVLWGNRLEGFIGPVFGFAPVALLGLRRRAVVVLVSLAAIFSLAWWMNAGARFLMLAIPFVALAMCAAVPRTIVLCLVIFQAISAWPQVMSLYAPPGFQLAEIPSLEASGDYRIARLVESITGPNDRIFDIHGVHVAHIDRRLTGPWQSAEGEMLMRSLEMWQTWLYELRASFPERSVRALRVRQTAASDSVWSVNELEMSGPVNRARWSLEAEPNRWETPLAFDGNAASRWISYEPSRPGQHLTVDFEGSELLTSVRLLSASPVSSLVIELRDDEWRQVETEAGRIGPLDLRRDAVSKLRRAGFRYIVAPEGLLGREMAADPEGWSLELAGRLGDVSVFRIR